VDEKSVELNLCRCPGRSIEDEEKKNLK